MKAVVITRTLALRRLRSEAFGSQGGYTALDVTGTHADAVLAFARADVAGARAVTIVSTRVIEAWDDTAVVLPEGAWRNVLDDDAPVVDGGAPVPLAQWLDRFPVAVLDRT